MKTFYSNGKLLVSGEYVVLDGGLSFALPTKFGQDLTIKEHDSNVLEWVSFDNEKQTWFTAVYHLNKMNNAVPEKAISTTSDTAKAVTLLRILQQAKVMNPDFLTTGGIVKTQLTFPTQWGLGTSSTLVNNIAQWAKVNAFTLLWNSFKGSGYDIACAQHNSPITYQITNGEPVTTPIVFAPGFTHNLYFVYLNQKMDTKVGVAHYRTMGEEKNELIDRITDISKRLISATDLAVFETLLSAHEDLISKYLKMDKVKDLYFADYWGTVKSLGAWGGDFVLATGNEETPDYFKSKGFYTVVRYADMIL